MIWMICGTFLLRFKCVVCLLFFLFVFSTYIPTQSIPSLRASRRLQLRGGHLGEIKKGSTARQYNWYMVFFLLPISNNNQYQSISVGCFYGLVFPSLVYGVSGFPQVLVFLETDMYFFLRSVWGNTWQYLSISLSYLVYLVLSTRY